MLLKVKIQLNSFNLIAIENFINLQISFGFEFTFHETKSDNDGFWYPFSFRVKIHIFISKREK